MIFKDRPLEVLDEISLPVNVRRFVKLRSDRVALLGEASVLVPIVQELSLQGLARFGKLVRRCLCANKGMRVSHQQDDACQS